MNRFKKPVFLVTYGLILYFFLLRFEVFSGVMLKLLNLTKPFIWGFALAYILNIPYTYFLTKLFKSNKRDPRYKLKKSLSLIASYLIFFFIIGFIFSMLIPQLGESINIFMANSTEYYQTLQNYLTDIVTKLKLEPSIWNEIQKAIMSLVEVLKGLLPSLIGVVTSTASGLVNLLGTLFISVYFLASKETLMSLVTRTLDAFATTKTKTKLKHVLEVTDQTFRGFIIGQLTDALIIGIITFVCSSLFGFPYPILLGFLAGVTNVIPVIGPFIGAVPCVLIILMVEPTKAIWYVIFITFLQQIDGNFICPKIVGDSTGLDGLWILLAVIVGGGFFGVVGCLLAVPLCAVAFKLYEEFLSHRLTTENASSSDSAPNPQSTSPHSRRSH